MNLQEFMSQTISVKRTSSGYSYQETRPRIFCEDGVSLSVQASSGMYCSPREDGLSYYSEVEVGYPSIRPPEEWGQYFDGEWQDLGFLELLNKS